MNRLPRLILIASTLLVLASCHTSSQYSSESEQIADKARMTFQSMMKDNNFPGLVDLAMRAKAIIIVPNMLRAAFFFSGNGGNAVMLARNNQGRWSDPAFYTIGGGGWGLQFGGQSSEIVVTVMTEKGLNAVMNRRVTLGADAGVALGELGEGVNAATGMDLKADMYTFARSQGLFAGISLNGAWIQPRADLDRQLYGPNATPQSILVDHASTSPSPAVTGLVAAMP
ncbi:MAG TPA: lipid-binding SYLF domain-containing protein [Alphaproteobacteria bacterium]|nr:lipid-binding SYLF domain-containing protein [Alphaproteobacteria bacterium]